MKLITNEQVAELITTQDAVEAMHKAFSSFQSGAQQTRVRTTAGKTMLSTMGAVLPGSGIAGTKVYTTVNGRFRFVIVLFSTEDGTPLAAIEGDEMTGLRTAAATAVAAEYLAPAQARTLAIIGTGVQARSHVPALCGTRDFSEILVAGVEYQAQFAAEAEEKTGIPARAVGIDEAAASADVLLTVTRSKTPLFSGELLKEGAFVAAIGASKPDVRELDDAAIRRASAIVVEWKPQAREEAGDLVLCEPDTFDWNRVLELGDVVAGTADYARHSSDIVIYKAVGVGLEDVALAGLVYQRACERYGWK
ncbi:MAG TPA: ornithine cyclodeaminase family protein [Noviherbaspirillum sp.]|nr:ornithine cyclodeaminase family protein [Noviherbaspirillum sp.]